MEVTLGLDLKGGMNVILELNVPDVLRSLANYNQNPDFNKALEQAYARQASSNKDYVELFAEEYKKLDPQAQLAGIFSTFELKERISPQSTDAHVISVIREEAKSAIDNSFNVLRTRIDQFGVVSPNIQRLETTGRILVELPGVKEPERVRKLLQGSANLEFWETYELTGIYEQLVTADATLARLLKANEPAADSTATTATTPSTSADSTALTAESETSEADSLLAQLGEDAASPDQNVSAEEFQKEHPLFAKLQLNADNSGRIAPGPVVGYALKNSMNTVMEYLNMPQIKAVLPRNVTFKWSVKPSEVDEQFYELYAIKVTNRDGRPALGGDVVTGAVADFSQQQIGRA
ncbi:MAG: protein translocase subunit SecDF, partial [Tannerella sp.]|nr:protein translocase subunit SecDF [Tannerella sp.]